MIDEAHYKPSNAALVLRHDWPRWVITEERDNLKFIPSQLTKFLKYVRVRVKIYDKRYRDGI